MRKIISFLFSFIFFIGCENEVDKNQSVRDNRSFAETDKAKITHFSWDVNIDFETKIISGTASYQFENNNSNEIILDTDNLKIDSVLLANGQKAAFTINPKDSILGSALVVEISPEDTFISVFYETSPDANALQWLSPQQTNDKTHPFLLTQGQSILTRSYIPIQDTPGIRITYDAKVRVPAGLMAVMSAVNPKEKNENGIYEFIMEQPIPPYLIALAVGNIAYQPIDKRTGVYAEVGLLEKAAWELEGIGDMLNEAEHLYGKYRWEQFDVLFLPPSFPFGGMENPRLTFATPTILAGDRSLVNLVAHELAHSWSGNLVTNATWDDFWLNEGFTVYLERRIMEELEGKNYADILSVIGFQDLKISMEQEPEQFTSLKVDLSHHHPDDAFSDVPYDKGYLFLKMLEERYGRENFDMFLNQYFKTYAFKTITTEEFVEYMKIYLTHGEDDFVQNWIYDTGWPKDLEAPVAVLFEEVEEKFNHDMLMSATVKPEEIDSAEVRKPGWSTHEWVHYLRLISAQNTKEQLAVIDKLYDFTESTNAEIQCAWFEKAILLDYTAVDENLREFLVNVGRRKFLEPLYGAMIRSGKKKLAKSIYKEARPNYHYVSYNTIDRMLD